jgi:hypothetical protein
MYVSDVSRNTGIIIILFIYYDHMTG